jgi:uncharacterized membrane protein YheB (UPF0754 family)
MNIDWHAVLADLRAHWWLYASIPVISGVIGYVTKVVAIQMMFRPLEFVGIKPPYLGWQGIVPRKAEKMATVAVELMTSKLISVEEVVARLDPARIAQELEAPMLAAVEDITRDVLAQQKPGLWETLPEFVRSRVIKRVQDDTPAAVAEMMREVRENIHEFFDLKHMVITNLVRDKALLNRIFQQVGRQEFKFFGNAGFYFGFAIGLVQMTVWLFYKAHWVLPAFGLVVGFVSDWIALQLLFWPKQPTRTLGFNVQGLFLKRQQQVASEYGELIAKQIITPHNIIEEILHGPASDKVIALVQRHVTAMVDEQAGVARPLLAFAIGSTKYQAIKAVVAQKLVLRLPEALRSVEHYAEDAMNVRGTVVEKMQQLTPEEFEGLLRPAFKEDEWSLIAVGAALGFFVGEMQVLLMTQ